MLKQHIIIIQTSITLSIVFGLYFFNQLMAKSVLLGAGIAILTTIYTLNKVFCKYDATKPAQLIQQFYTAQVGRILIVMALFAIVFVRLMPVNVIGLLTSYLFMHLLPLFLIPNNLR